MRSPQEVVTIKELATLMQLGESQLAKRVMVLYERGFLDGIGQYDPGLESFFILKDSGNDDG
jgi:hypothetical protein